MANIIGQVLGSIRGLFSGSPSVPSTPAPAVAEAPSDGLTGVQRYLATLAEEAQPEAAPLTGVAKYLAQLAEEEAAARARTILDVDTGVARYLAALAVNPSPAAGTGVQRYLANLAAESAVGGETEEDRAAAEGYRARAGGKTSVQSYLDGQGLSDAPAATGKTRVEQYLASLAASSAPAPEAEVAAVVEAAPEAEATSEPEAEQPAAAVAEEPAASALVDLSAGAKQCQASTLKGTQCRNTSGLERIQRTIDGKDYQFAVCAHHTGDSFKPYRGVLGG